MAVAVAVATVGVAAAVTAVAEAEVVATVVAGSAAAGNHNSSAKSADDCGHNSFQKRSLRRPLFVCTRDAEKRRACSPRKCKRKHAANYDS
jgi:hypothetical protein